ncbi:hypothetical protein J7L67_07850 [bacterium]|nr:hypothetical protein [bacterium]
MDNIDSEKIGNVEAQTDKSTSEMEKFFKIYEERNRKQDEKFGQVYTTGALLYLLIGMILVIAGFTAKSFLGIFVLIPIGLSFFVASYCQYSAAKKFFNQ